MSETDQYALIDLNEGESSLETYAKLGDATSRQITEPGLVLLQRLPGGRWAEFYTGTPLEEEGSDG